MALKPCRECGKEVSSEAKVCPNCGITSPTTDTAAAKKGCIGCLGVVVVVIIAASLFDTSDSVNTSSNAVPDVNRVWVDGAAKRLDSLSLSDSLRFDALVHSHAPEIEHAAIHERVTTLRLDSATAALRASGGHVRARTHLAAIAQPLTDAQSARFARLNERTSKLEADAASKAAIEARRMYARQLEQDLLDKRLDTEVRALGAAATTLQIKYVLFSRVWANEFSKNTEMMSTIRALGFKKFRITDGYDFAWEWTF